MRALHRASLQALPAPTRARLRAARHGAGQAHAAPARRWGWLLAAAPAVLGTAFGMHLLLRPALPPSMPAASVASAPTATAASAVAQGDTDDTVAGLLEENPDLYLWLGSDTSLAMEWTR
ncbi:hypothetical protein [Xanthomonas theicola]|uniref:Uncharacterized protein n=1 Tax=Xanthomonas theicola TaxID=56464 RepID=A0A2S6ZEP7_9XANT|nr:hypothetical protein [Xanthomonas theicola]PPT90646.1 hypothetical protein XthCFBP4691_11410 [Xanthomonas theicola]QNH27191.1 hypothetical protein G4Q83_22175 [Xanthomonas theicola]